MKGTKKLNNWILTEALRLNTGPNSIFSTKSDTVTNQIKANSASETTSSIDNVTASAGFHEISILRNLQFRAPYRYNKKKTSE